jgi:DNA primase
MAGRIPQSFIDDLLARVNIVDVIDGRVKLKKAGKNYSGLCPFHQEKSPSFSVSPDKQFYYCFGCGAGGNAIGFLMEYERLEFPQAVEEVAKMVGVDVPKDESIKNRRPEHKAQYQILEEANDFFQLQLRSHAQKNDAINYLKKRGLTGKVAQFFGIGYAPPGWSNLLDGVGSNSEKANLLELSGMLIRHEEKDSLYDRFRHRIMFPIRDVRGRVIGFGGRVLGDDKPKYLNSPETETFHKGRELYGLYEARKLTQRLERIVIVEGYMDVISLAQFGITYSVATLGTATTEHHLERLFKTVSEIIFCFDGDAAGRKAASRALETALPVIKDGQEAKFLFLPDGEDPDTLVRNGGADAFEQQLREALPLSEFFFKSLSEQSDMTSIDGRARFSSQALPMIQKMKPGLLKEMMFERISEVTGLTADQINSTIQLTQPKAPSESPSSPAPTYEAPEGYEDYPSYDAHPIPYADEEHYRGHEPTKGRTELKPHNKPAGQSSSNALSLCAHLISLLLHEPKLVKLTENNLPPVQDLKDPQATLLHELLGYLIEHGEKPLPFILVDWRDDDHLSGHLVALSEISRLDPILTGDPGRLFLDAWKRLTARCQEVELSKLQKRPLSTLSQDEKKRLAELLTACKRP